jgi:D-glycero-D-manno-heptose 1,7-bisphosphate phosphatase
VPIQVIVIACDGLLASEDLKGRWYPLVTSLDALARLTHAGFSVAVTVALCGAASPKERHEQLAARQTVLQRLAGEAGGLIDAFFFCPHAPRQACDCRAPQPGLYRQIAARWRIDLARVPCLAATAADLTAAAVAGGLPIEIGTFPNSGERITDGTHPAVDSYPDLGHCVDAVLASRYNG